MDIFDHGHSNPNSTMIDMTMLDVNMMNMQHCICVLTLKRYTQIQCGPEIDELMCVHVLKAVSSVPELSNSKMSRVVRCPAEFCKNYFTLDSV